MHASSTACVDASLTVAFVAGRHYPSIERLWEQLWTERTSLIAPRLIRYEAVNGIHRLRLTGTISELAATEGIATLLDLPIALHDDHHLHESAARIAWRFSLSAASVAHYLALAERFECPFWTADKRLARTVQNDLPWVRLVEY
jgi:predicted nucleic acid-binding protein